MGDRGGANHRAGDFMYPQFQIECSLAGEGTPFNIYENAWYDHFSLMQLRSSFDLPEPCILNNCSVALRGGLKPEGERTAIAGTEYIYRINGEYSLVDMGDIRSPTKEEYDKYFKQMYENNTPRIRQRRTRKGVVLSDRKQKSVVIFP